MYLQIYIIFIVTADTLFSSLADENPQQNFHHLNPSVHRKSPKVLKWHFPNKLSSDSNNSIISVGRDNRCYHQNVTVSNAMISYLNLDVTSPPTTGRRNRAFYMCLRDYVDTVSNLIKSSGIYLECESLLKLWKTTASTVATSNKTSSSHHDGGGGGGIFVDAGANIGTCSVMMAAVVGAPVFAFEPVLSNLYYFKHSVLGNIARHIFSPDMISLYPCGLGDKEEETVIYSQDGNAGNSVVNAVVPDWDTGKTRKAMKRNSQELFISTLDAVLWPNCTGPPPLINVMKIDVQGYELRVLHGAANLLKAQRIKSIKVELSGAHLKAQGTSAAEVCAALVQNGFDVFKEDMVQRINETYCGRLDRPDATEAYEDIIAIHKGH
jgi:FkbM family methyltransferase